MIDMRQNQENYNQALMKSLGGIPIGRSGCHE